MAEDNPNAHLVGRPGSRKEILTPALVLDVDALERNIRRMADFARSRGIGLRPHAKTHKSVRIARLQVDGGALGVSATPLGEAKTMVAAGIADVLITSPVVHPEKIKQLAELNLRAEGLMVVADHPDNVDALQSVVHPSRKPMKVLVDLDVGIGRTGARTAEDALAVARKIAAAPDLVFMGVQAYAGTVQHIAGYRERQEAVTREYVKLRRLLDLLEQDGLQPAMVTGAGTGTYEMDGELGLFTELQVGSYIFTDAHYNTVALSEDDPRPFEPSLFVRGTVISINQPGCVTTDTGLKRFATEGPLPPQPALGAPPGSGFRFKGDEHALVLLPDGAEKPRLGQGIEFVTSHCDPTVNLYDWYHVVRGDILVDIWPVDARGAI
jgi:3-hydroxy-D-aspartate aldolase